MVRKKYSMYEFFNNILNFTIAPPEVQAVKIYELSFEA
jgi:hypothetical protein